MRPRVGCTALNSHVGPHLQILSEAGFEPVVPPAGMKLSDPKHLVAALEGCEAVIAGSEPYTPEVFAGLKDLRVIARWGVGFDAVNLQEADRRKIVVATTPGCNHHSVAELAITMMMAVSRGFPRLDQQVRAGKWVRIPLPRLQGKTLGLVGLGRIGQATATRAIGLGMNVIAYEPFPNREFVAQQGIELVDLDTLYARSPFISLHLPSTPETKHLINRESIAKMQRGTVIVNTSRGPLIKEADLVEGLVSGHLGGAGLDVFETEPLPLESPLMKLDNVLLSGHVAGMDQESERDTATMAANIIVDLHRGKWPEGCVQNLKGLKAGAWKW